MLQISSLSGLWTRSFKSWSDGRRDTTTNVGWLQGATLYGDLRQPADLPDFGHAAGLDGLSRADCARLAAQEGFAGIFRHSGANFEWVRLIDFHPAGPMPDIGRLFWRDEILVEQGLQGEYLEHWHRAPNIPAADCAGVAFVDAKAGCWGCLLRAGDLFIYARDRGVQLGAASLAEAVAAAPDAAAARRLIDFEISLGEISAAGWRITRSTLPFRAGDALNPEVGPGRLTIADRAADGAPSPRVFEITYTEGDPSFLAA